MIIKKTLTILFSLMFLCLITVPVLAEAESETNGSAFSNSDINYLKEEARSLKQTDLGGPNLLIGSIIKLIVGISGAIALAMVVYGGFVWMTAAGNAEKISSAQKIIIWALLGLVALSISYLVLNILLNFASTGNAVFNASKTKS